jgi:uncharacterized protein YegL
MESIMASRKEFTTQSARPLPVILLADVSGSMEADGKIQALNHAVREMISSFQGEDDLRAEIQLAVIAFGDNTAKVHLPLAHASQSTWTDMPASGSTPMGAAFQQALTMLEDRATIPSRAYRPTLVLLSDGQPNDEWKAPLDALLKSERGAKAFRMALAIGSDADTSVLQAFLANPEAKVLRAEDARQIRTVLRFVTMTVMRRSRSATPNAIAPLSPDDDLDV